MADIIVIDQDLCLNFNYKKMTCQLCRSACPGGCINEELQIDSNCNGCGLCIAACPAEAVAGLGYTNRSIQAWREGDLPVAIVCRKNESTSPWPCLGFLNSSLLLWAGSGNRSVVVDTTSCEGCKGGVLSHLQAAIDEANHIRRSLGSSEIRQGKTAAEGQDKSITRRAFFGQLFGAAVDTVREVARPSDDKPERLERHQFITAIKPALAEVALLKPTAAFSGLTISAACEACGICAKFCTTKAITIRDRMDEIDIFHDPLKCTGCNVCASHCPAQAITVGQAEKLASHTVITARLPRCARCDSLYQPVNHATVCLECMLKSRPGVM